VTRSIRPPSWAVGAAALVLVSCSGAYAAGLATGSVRTKHLATGAVTAKKVKPGSLKSVDLRVGTVPQGVAGAAGEPGPPGPTGPAGSARGTANVNYDGTVYQSTGTLAGISVQHAGTGIYCIHGADRGPDDVWWGTSFDGSKGFVVVDDYYGWADCASSAVRVTTYLPNGNPADWDLALAML
jgi:hypothetical protein